MNNRQANRRRGRGNNRVQGGNRGGGGGFDHQNRIDNRARGNASQMLEKYKKLASDAQMNDDRVNAEYYLQFADHYFRVLADFRARQEERQQQDGGRRENYRDNGRDWLRDQNQDEDDEDGGDDDGNQDEDDSPRSDERRPAELEARNRQRQDRQRGERPRRELEREDEDESGATLDRAALPPSLSTSRSEDGEADAAPPPRARRRSPRSPRGEETAPAAAE